MRGAFINNGTSTADNDSVNSPVGHNISVCCHEEFLLQLYASVFTGFQFKWRIESDFVRTSIYVVNSGIILRENILFHYTFHPPRRINTRVRECVQPF